MQEFYLHILRAYFFLSSRLTPSLALKSAYKLFHTPMTPPLRSSELKLLDTAYKFNVQIDEEVLIQAYRWGKKEDPLILLVHGWSTGPTSFSPLIKKLLKMNYQVVGYDAIAHGLSQGGFPALINWSESLKKVAFSLGKIDCIISHSLGSGSVIIASSLGLRTDKLVLISPMNNAVSVTNKFAKHFKISSKVIEKMRTYTWNKFEDTSSKYGKDWEDVFISDFKVDTLVIHDEEDKEVGIEDAHLLLKRWPWAKFIQTKGLGHRRILYDKKVHQNILDFLRKPL